MLIWTLTETIVQVYQMVHEAALLINPRANIVPPTNKKINQIIIK